MCGNESRMCHYYPGDKPGWEITSALLEITSAQPGIQATFSRMGVIREQGKSPPKIKTQEFGFSVLCCCISYVSGFFFVCLVLLFCSFLFGFLFCFFVLFVSGFFKFAFQLLHLESAA